MRLAYRWQWSIFDNADHDVQMLMMYTRAAFYATEPSNAAAYAPVEACGAHEWSYIAHGWRAVSAASGPESDASAHGQEGGSRPVGTCHHGGKSTMEGWRTLSSREIQSPLVYRDLVRWSGHEIASPEGRPRDLP